jgi:hypothetical protein
VHVCSFSCSRGALRARSFACASIIQEEEAHWTAPSSTPFDPPTYPAAGAVRAGRSERFPYASLPGTTPDNASKVWRALLAFGAPLQELTERDLSTPNLVFQIGVAPYRIDLLTSIEGVSFDEAWRDRVVVRVEGQDIPLIGREDLLRNKRATGRLRDLADAEELEKLAT